MSTRDMGSSDGPCSGGHRQMPYGQGSAAWMAWAAESPPMKALALEPVQMTDGYACLSVARSVIPLNPNGAVHGGLLASFVDQAGALAVVTSLSPGQRVVTGTLNVSYLRPAMLPLSIEASVERRTRSIIFVRITVRSGGRPCTEASGAWVPIQSVDSTG